MQNEEITKASKLPIDNSIVGELWITAFAIKVPPAAKNNNAKEPAITTTIEIAIISLRVFLKREKIEKGISTLIKYRIIMGI